MASMPDHAPHPNPPQPVDLILRPRWIIPVEPANLVLENHDLVIQQGCIVALSPRAETAQRYLANQIEDLPEHVLMPGLVNAHCHAGMALMRGIADDQPLKTWL